jgi:cutinase
MSATRRNSVALNLVLTSMNKLLGLALAAVAATGALIGTSAMAPSLATASDHACPAVQVVFARGTGEPAGLGRVGQAFVDSLRADMAGTSVATYAVNYPATRDFVLALDGAGDASAFVSNIAATCPATKIVLGGYSQGAAVVDLITAAEGAFFGYARPMDPAVASHVAALAVFGNPSNKIGGGPLTAISPLYGDKAIDLCNGGDPVCSNGNDVAAHSLYGESGMTSQAAQFVAQRLTAPNAASPAVLTSGGDAPTVGEAVTPR